VKYEIKKSGEAAETKHILSTECNSRKLLVTVRKVLQKEWTFRRASRCYNAPWSILKVNLLMLRTITRMKKSVVGKISTPFPLSFDETCKICDTNAGKFFRINSLLVLKPGI
jgi:hypothetical protein